MVKNPKIVHITDAYREKAIAYLSRRIENSHESLWYMFNGVNRTDAALFKLNGEEMKIQKNQLYVVVFAQF